MDDGVPPVVSPGPCRECGRSLPRATMRYCVHCGADVADVTGATDVRGAGSGSADGPWTRGPGTPGGPWVQEPASDWSTGEFRAPSPLDGVPVLPPVVPPEPLTLAPADASAEAPTEAPADASSGLWGPAAWYAGADPSIRPASGAAAEGVVPGPLVSGGDADPAGLAPWPEGMPGNQVLAPLPYLPLPAGRRSRREPLMLIVGAIMVLFVVSAGGLFWLNGRGGDPVTAPGGGPVPAASVPMSVSSAAAGPTASSPAAGSTGSGDATTGVGADVLPSTVAASGSASPDVVRSLDALIERSAEARGDVVSTAVALQSCRMSATAAAVTFRRARDNRNELASEASALSGSGAGQPVGDAVRAFIALQKSSAQADDAFADWASEVATAGCSGQARRTANLDLANRYSGDATAAKARFVTLWNPIAVAHGLSERSADAI